MSRARDLANFANGIDASKITSGTFADARLSATSVQQYASTFDDNKIINDISTLALRQASNENKSAYNTNSMYVDVFQDDTGITNLTNSFRNANEYINTVSETSIYFKDNGRGIKRKNWNDIFRPGFSTKKRGWGLGLSLTQRIVEDIHKGAIIVTDSSKDGTTIKITFNK